MKDEKRKNNDGTTIFGAVCAFFDRTFAKMCKKSLPGRYFTSYERFDHAVLTSKTARSARDKRKKRLMGKYHPKKEIGTEQIDKNLNIYNDRTLRAPISRRLRSAAHSNRAISFATSLAEKTARTPASTLGFFLLALSLTAMVVKMAGFFTADTTDAASVFFSLVMLFPFLVVSVFLLPKSDVSLGEYVFESKLGNLLIIPMLGREDSVAADRYRVSYGAYVSALSFGIGFLLGLSTFIIPISVIIRVLAVSLLLALIVVTPEAGLLVFAFFAPFLSLLDDPDMIAALFVTLVALCYASKAALGKRIASMDALDIVFALLFAFGAVCELFGGYEGSAKRALALVSCFGIYYLCRYMLTRGRWLDKFLSCISASSTIVGAISISQAIITRKYIGISSVMRTPESLALWLLASIFLTHALYARKKLSPLSTLFSLVVQVAALFLTGSKSALITLVIGIVLLSIMSGKGGARYVFFGLIAASISLPFLPQSVLQKLLSVLLLNDDSLLARIEVWENSLKAAMLEPLCGIGFSRDLFTDVYALISEGKAASNAQSLAVGLFVTSGIVGVVFFAIAVILCLRAAFSACSRMPRKMQGREILCAATCAVIAYIICGTTVWIFDDVITSQAFFALIGICLAVKKHFEEERASLRNELTPESGDVVFDAQND